MASALAKFSMKKTYVLDTNVILHNPHAILSFEDNDIVIPDVVIDELDKHKTDKGEIGANARAAARIIRKMIKHPENGNLIDGYNMDNGGTIRIEMNCLKVDMPSTWEPNNDLRVLRVCKGLKEKGQKIILVSNDSYVRIKAEILGIKAEEFTTERAPEEHEQYTGRREGFVNSDVIDKLYAGAIISTKEIKYYNDNGEEILLPDMILHEYLVLKTMENPSKSALAYYTGVGVALLENNYEHTYGIKPKNVAQKFALNAIKSNAPLAIIKGPAGTGKTLLAIAAGLEAVEKGLYRRVLYLRGNIKLDEDIGFLPGSEEEKLSWALRPVKDNLEIIFGGEDKNENFSSAIKTRKGANKYKSQYEAEFDDKSFLTGEIALQDKINEIFARDIIRIEAVGHMRGRSISKTMVIIDEAQNLTPNQIRTLLTRSSGATKIVLMGDPAQIDHQYLDTRTNGLSVASERMAGSPTTMQVTFYDSECERSELSKEVASRMGDK